jgi:plastocyanin
VRTGPQRLATLAACTLLAAGAAGCGRGDDNADLANGKTLFTGKATCGSCHTLSRAGTKGIRGPNFDDAFRQSRLDGYSDKTFEGVVRRQIANARRSSIMPRDLVTGDDARDVAAYVAFAAGRPGKDTGALAKAGQPKVSNQPIEAKAGKLEIDADPTGALAFASTKATAAAGVIQFLMADKSQIQHNIAVKDAAGKTLGQGPIVGGGGSSKFSAKLAPGKYTFFCAVPGHEAGGMKGELTVK